MQKYIYLVQGHFWEQEGVWNVKAFLTAKKAKEWKNKASIRIEELRQTCPANPAAWEAHYKQNEFDYICLYGKQLPIYTVAKIALG